MTLEGRPRAAHVEGDVRIRNSEPMSGGTTKDRIIDAATELFYSQGFHAVGLDRILDEVGVTKTTFYNHFESKDELIVSMLRKRDEVETGELMRQTRERAGDDPAARLLAVFDVLLEWFTEEGFRGCIFMNAAVAYPDEKDPIHVAAAAHGASLYDSIFALAKAAGVADPDLLTREALLLVAGAITARHVGGERDSAALARRTMETLLERRSTGTGARSA